MEDFELGAAYSAAGASALYLALAAALARRQGDAMRLLVESFLALGIVFATLTIPLAFDARVTAALAVDAPDDPRLQLSLRETYATLLFALDGLSPALKSAVVLTSLSGLSYEEAAAVLGTSPGAVAVRIHEARKQLKSALSAAERERSVTRRRAPEKQTTSATLELAMSLASLL